MTDPELKEYWTDRLEIEPTEEQIRQSVENITGVLLLLRKSAINQKLLPATESIIETVTEHIEIEAHSDGQVEAYH